jgi:hypothetical protein
MCQYREQKRVGQRFVAFVYPQRHRSGGLARR